MSFKSFTGKQENKLFLIIVREWLLRGVVMLKHYKLLKLFKLKKIPYDRSYTLYNIGLIYGNTGKYTQALEFIIKFQH
jgi:hypothetical protein